MNVIKGINLLVRFLLELSMLAALGYWGYKTHSSGALKILAGIGLPILIAVVWGVFMAPKSTRQLSGVPFTVMDFILLGSGVVAWYASGQITLAWIYAAVLIIHEVLRLIWKQ